MENNYNTTEIKLLPIDTVKIILPKGSYKLNNTQQFKPNYIGFTRTATKQEKHDGFYCPKVTIHKLTGSCTIEFSLPKLFFGNNLQELCLKDCRLLVKSLQLRLLLFGIGVDEETLLAADLYRVDFGKNFDLTPLCTVPEALYMLNRCIGFGRKSIYQIQYQNGGRALRLQNASTDLLLYDKLHSYEMVGMSGKMSVETDHYCQKPLYEILNVSGKSVLRIEKRFANRRAVKRLFALYGIISPTFGDIFNPKIGRDIITTEWQMLVKACILPTKNQGKNLLEQVIDFLKTGQCNTLGIAFSYVGLQELLKTYSVKDLKKRFAPYVGKNTMDNWFSRIHKLASECGVRPNFLDEITRQITAWQPFELFVDSIDGENI